MREYEFLNRGREFPYTYDRTHNVSLALMLKLNKKLSFGANWIYATGQPTTLADSYVIYNMEGIEYYQNYESINGFRLPNYHRLDLSMQYKKMYKSFNYSINTGVYNAYNRRNAYSVNDSDEHLSVNSLLGLLPYVSISFGFNTNKHE